MDRLPLRSLQLFVLLGALLLFGLEPMVGKILLPGYGGSFYVWSACLTFFQGALLVGYLYCHLFSARIGAWHLILLAAPLLLLPINAQRPPDPDHPLLSILITLTLEVGLPFVALATTSVAAQVWMARSERTLGHNPYALYAASNLGSLLALVAYPLLIEPLLSLPTQRIVWSVGYGVYLVVAIGTIRALRVSTGSASSAPTEPEATATNSTGDKGQESGDVRTGEQDGPRTVLWLLLSAIPSAFLLATTNVITLDVGSFPFLWVVPLALYLATFILAFRDPPWCPALIRRFWFELSLVGVCFYELGYMHLGGLQGVGMILGLLGVLFIFCLVAHRELYCSKPAPAHLTRFYLTVSLGGWIGGVLVTLVAPLVFSQLWEYPLCVLALAVVLAVARLDDLQEWFAEQPRPKLIGSGVILALLASMVGFEAVQRETPLHSLRNFYGIYTVDEVEIDAGKIRLLTHGTTLHGMQALWDPSAPSSYYGSVSPVRDALEELPPPREAAVVGLGVGTLATYFKAGERLTFYELDPQNEAIARNYFTYLADSAAEVKVVPGDARLSLAETPAEALDVLVIDAFSSDAIPVHLLTQEALELYLSRLEPGGVLLFHISNRFFDLRPVLTATAGKLGQEPLFRASTRADAAGAEFEGHSSWCAISRDAALLSRLRARGWLSATDQSLEPVPAWTDGSASVLSALWRSLRN